MDFFDAFDRIDSGGISLGIIGKYQGTEDILPFYWWNIIADGTPVGKISLRVGDARQTDNYYFNGNIGYAVDEPFRGHNYSEKAVRLLMSVAKAHGMDELIISCNETNIASYKTIENLGGELIEISETPREYFAWFDGIERKRIYRVEVNT